jgi:hypothetical protein
MDMKILLISFVMIMIILFCFSGGDKFKYNDSVKIKSGFYKGSYGTVKYRFPLKLYIVSIGDSCHVDNVFEWQMELEK